MLSLLLVFVSSRSKFVTPLVVSVQLIMLGIFCFRYAVMRSCWHEDPDKRLTFRQLHRALNKLDKEIQV